MKARQLAIVFVLVATMGCAGPQQFAGAGIQTTCGNLMRAVTGGHDPTVVLSVPNARDMVINVSSRRVGALEGLEGRVESAKAAMSSVGAECTSRSGSYRFEIRGSRTERVALQLMGVGPAQVVVEHDGEVLGREYVDLSAEERVQISL